MRKWWGWQGRSVGSLHLRAPRGMVLEHAFHSSFCVCTHILLLWGVQFSKELSVWHEFTCVCDSRGGTRWALLWGDLLGHRCSIQVRSSENSEWIGGGVRVWATCPWARPVDDKGLTQEDGQGECGELPSKTNIQRVCSSQTSCRLMLVSRCMGYSNTTVLLLPALSGLLKLMWFRVVSLYGRGSSRGWGLGVGPEQRVVSLGLVTGRTQPRYLGSSQVVWIAVWVPFQQHIGVSSPAVWWDLGQTHSRCGGRGRKDRRAAVQLVFIFKLNLWIAFLCLGKFYQHKYSLVSVGVSFASIESCTHIFILFSSQIIRIWLRLNPLDPPSMRLRLEPREQSLQRASACVSGGCGLQPGFPSVTRSIAVTAVL